MHSVSIAFVSWQSDRLIEVKTIKKKGNDFWTYESERLIEGERLMQVRLILVWL